MSNRLKELRQQNNLTLKELGKKVSMLDSTLSQYETEKRNPDNEVWEKLANFFNVSVSYIKGESYSKEDLIEIIHKLYFSNWYQYSGTSSGFDFNPSSHIENDIDLYIDTVCSNAPLPKDLYPKNTKEFPLTDQVKKYWADCFNILLEPIAKKDIPKKVDNTFVIRILIDAIKSMISYVEKNGKTTALGTYFDNECTVEDEFHKKAIYNIRFANLEMAKKQFNEYFEYMKYLKDKIDNFDANKYFDKEMIFWRKLQSKGLSKKQLDKMNEIFDEMDKEVKGGDTELRDYMLKEAGEYADVINPYYEFKKKNKEDVTNINEYFALFETN